MTAELLKISPVRLGHCCQSNSSKQLQLVSAYCKMRRGNEVGFQQYCVQVSNKSPPQTFLSSCWDMTNGLIHLTLEYRYFICADVYRVWTFLGIGYLHLSEHDVSENHLLSTLLLPQKQSGGAFPPSFSNARYWKAICGKNSYFLGETYLKTGKITSIHV